MRYPGFWLVLTCGVLAGVVLAPSAHAHDDATATDEFAFVPTASQVHRAAARCPSYGRRPCKRGWEFHLAIPIWIPGVTGSMAEGGVEIEADPDTDAILNEMFDTSDDLKFGFLGAVVARKNRWTIALDGFGVRLGSGVNFRLTDDTVVDGTIFALIARATVRYEVLRRPVRLPRCGRGCLSLDAFAGARFYRAGFDMNLPEGVKLKAEENWLDPIVGVVATADLSRKWSIQLEGDVGGFGVGSDIAWWIILAAEWRFARRWTLLFGYGIADVTYGDVQDFAWNLTLNGPILGIKFSF